MTRCLSLAVLAAGLAAVARGQDPKADPVKPAASKITAVTLYQSTALVTREVTLPDAAGVTEVVVSPMPPQVIPTSLYAEGGDAGRVLSVRFRTRAIAEDTREEVRKLEGQLKTLTQKGQSLQADLKAAEENLKLLDKLEGFTAKSLETVTDKGQLDPEKIITLAKFVQDDRAKRAKDALGIKQQIEALNEQAEFTKRLLGERAGGSVRTERDAIVLVDKKAGPGAVRLSYLVSSASWRPVYKLRAGAKDKDPVTLEYLAAVEQQTGEDWSGVNLTLSTAQPLLNAAPPDLRALEVAVGGPVLAVGGPGGVPNGPPGQPGLPGAGGPGVGGGGFGGMPNPTAFARGLEQQAKGQRAAARQNYTENKADAGAKLFNDAAALEQFRDVVLDRDELFKVAAEARAEGAEMPSVAYRPKGPTSLPSRTDEQVLEVARFDLTPRFYYKAVPVLTPNVYRLADLVNTSELVLLPGEATMYLGGDFVGQTRLPLVAVGKPFTVGFGADPQLQVSRTLLDKTRTTQGGNQVLTFRYRISVSSYKKDPVPVQVWDRLPHAEAAMTIAVNLVSPKPELSADPLYQRDERPKGLLRWDVTAKPDQNGEKALAIEYEYKIEYDKNVTIGGLLAK